MVQKPVHDTKSALERYRAQVVPIVHALRDYAKAVFHYVVRMVDEYPPLKAFMYSLAASSAIPLAVFAGYSTITFLGAGAVAVTGLALVQGGFVLFGAFWLFWFLLGSVAVALITTFWFTLAYTGYKVVQPYLPARLQSRIERPIAAVQSTVGGGASY
ncbi:hypothetical protein SeMB42_g03117 [Synchytrium endobioticum]|uniref:Uncharacterized protein n=1 Tax=Synchytrium endobioticum TaxID=286115 RepID=A0A507D9E9_9FUNG|nr:hypothetical protein SeLEV6574_g05827 [Synchytrium endobioticum]TPX48116.1 hypothetical protein SeMB42_g03117 [Synchytrium endobioticum]